MINPETKDVISFEAQITQAYDSGETYIDGVKGGHCTKLSEDDVGIICRHMAEDGGWTPEITWVRPSDY